MIVTAAYSPEDDKIRMRASARLDKELYERVKAAGFRWAPKQDLFFTVWGPAAEDLALELAGEITDEDTSLVERAEERAERFEEYQGKRTHEAERAHAAVAAIADNIPLGQPILRGHHSERHARRDKERIETGMRKAIKLWDTASYWQDRAKGALRHAKYKELPAVRYRRIKTLEATRRKCMRSRDEAMTLIKLWAPGLVDDGMTREQALRIAGAGRGYGVWSDLDKATITVREAAERLTASGTRACEHSERWIAHLDNRLAYEKAMLGEQGDIVASKFDIEVGGQVLGRWGWAVVLRVNKKDGKVLSFTTAARFAGVIGVEEVKDYKAPEPGDAEKVKAATKLGPLVNYPGEGFRHITAAEWARFSKWTDQGRAHRVKATEKHGAHRLRMVPKEGRPYYDQVGAYITDQKRVDPPPPEGGEKASLPALTAPPERPFAGTRERAPDPAKALREALKAGVQVVVADQLFPTPEPLARRMAEELDARSGERVLEPSAGTGNLIRAVFAHWQEARKDATELTKPRVDAVEVNARLADQLRRSWGNNEVFVSEGDFLEMAFREDYDCVIMNPPFKNGQDIEHVKWALKFLRPGGVLVALVANGPKQNAKLRPLAEANGSWEELPEGSFAEQGTNVRVAMLVIRLEAARAMTGA